ncbi:MAG: hypothetical protein AB1486_29785 [Planctomycetota bacterium]
MMKRDSNHRHRGRAALVVMSVLAVVTLVLAVAWWSLPKGYRPLPPAGAPASSGASFARRGITEPLLPAPADAGDLRRELTGAASSLIRGLVIDEAGRPIPNARVGAYPDDRGGPAVLKSGARAYETRTDNGGRFDLRIDDIAIAYGMLAEASAFAPAVKRDVHSGDEVTLTLRRARALVGFVRDLEGRPIAGARVDWLWISPGGRIEREGATDLSGAYRVEGLPDPETTADTSCWIRVDADGYASLVLLSRAGVALDAQGDYRQDFRLGRGATVKGMVYDAETDEPLPGASVFLWSKKLPARPWPGDGALGTSSSARAGAETRTDSTGAFVFERLPTPHLQNQFGAQPVETLYPNLVAAVAPGYVPDRDHVRSREGQTCEVELRCYPEAIVQGRVVDAKETPIPGAFVSGEAWPTWRLDLLAIPQFFVPGITPGKAATDGQGYYRLAVPAPRTQPAACTLKAETAREDLARASALIIVTVQGGTVTHAPDIIIASLGSAFIHVSDTAGKAIAGARVSQAGENEVIADAQGCAVVKAPEGKPLKVQVTAQGYAPASSSEFRPSTVSPPDVDVVLEPEHRVAGHVLKADGSPVPHAAVGVIDGRTRFAGASVSRVEPGVARHLYGKTTTDSQGHFEVGGLPPGPYHVIAGLLQDPTEQQARLEGVGEATDLVLILTDTGPKSGSLDIRIVDAVTRLRVHQEVRCVLSDYGWANASQVELGHYRFEDVPLGKHELSVTTEG